jgi:TRAP-type C4-dicarboxylate transport system substrate-binding protein
MKIFKLLSAGLLLGFGLSSTAFGETVTLKFHSFAPAPASQNSKFVKPWADRIEEQSGGELKVETYFAMQLGGKPPQLVDQVRDGVVDIIWTVAGYTPGRFPKIEVFDLPFLPGSAEATSQAAQEFAETIAIEELKDFKILAVHVHSPGKIHTKDRLVMQLSDLEGLKMRGPTRVISSMLGAMGATPVGMPVPQVAPSLSKGVIDGMVVPYEIMPSFKLHELTKAHTTVSGERGLYTTAFLFLMNKAKYESLSDAHKTVIDNNSGMSLAKLAGQLWDGFEGPALELAKRAGGDFHSLSGEKLAAFKAVGDQVVTDWIAKANSNGMDGAAIVQTVRDLILKYEN